MKLNIEQKKAFEILASGKNVFLTGNAGTGKSFLVKEFIRRMEKDGKRVMVLAPTGIAAKNVGGDTIHKFLWKATGREELSLENCLKLSDNYLRKRNLSKVDFKLINETDVFVMDEISMIRYDLFEVLISLILLRDEDAQVVLVGDFHQLPPVFSEDERQFYEQHLRSAYPRLGDVPYAFKSQLWDTLELACVELKTIVRQTDLKFIENLNLARIGSEKCLKVFNKRVVRDESELDKQSIWLFGDNESVASENQRRLSMIEGREFESEMTLDFDYGYKGFRLADGLRRRVYDRIPSDIAEKEYAEVLLHPKFDKCLRYKVGARVMMTVNDSDGLYQNGSFGTIVGIDDRNGKISIKMDNGIKKGLIVSVGKKCEYVKTYLFDTKENKWVYKRFVSAMQFPFKLAYAVTVHKSQGKTFDKVVIDPQLSEKGQLYVALSRCSSLEGIQLIRPITPEALKANEEVLEFDRELIGHACFDVT